MTGTRALLGHGVSAAADDKYAPTDADAKISVGGRLELSTGGLRLSHLQLGECDKWGAVIHVCMNNVRLFGTPLPLPLFKNSRDLISLSIPISQYLREHNKKY